MKLTTFITLLFFSVNAFCADTCSRVAVINHQEILVDPSSSAKGEGLANYLEKDKVATSYFNEYRDGNALSLKSAAVSTLGTIMIIYGAFQNSENEDESSNLLEKKETFIVGGATLIFLSYLFSTTYQFNNEKKLDTAVKEYNKRNNPKIYFSPYFDVKGNNGIGLGMSKEF
jgi:hypothetical protein